MAMASPDVWMSMTVATIGCLAFDLAAKFYNRQTYPARWMILQEKYTTETEALKASLPPDTRKTPLLQRRDTAEEMVVIS